MKVTLTYGSSFDLIITTLDNVFTCEMHRCTLQDAVDYAESLFNDETCIHAHAIEKIMICDRHTGEICAECEPSPFCVGAEEYQEASLDSFDEDWDYNEDEGFDPYLRCYTDDC